MSQDADTTAEEITIRIFANLDQHEAEMLASLLRDYIVKNREIARMEHLAGEITQAELKWHLQHADYIDVIATKLFPGWE